MAPETCATCRGDGYIGTGYSNSFVDISDAMPCPTCGGEIGLATEHVHEHSHYRLSCDLRDPMDDVLASVCECGEVLAAQTREENVEMALTSGPNALTERGSVPPESGQDGTWGPDPDAMPRSVSASGPDSSEEEA